MIWPLDIDFWINLIVGTLETYAATKIIIGVNALLVPIFWGHFYFDPYIYILPLLVPKTKKKMRSILVITFTHLTEKSYVANRVHCLHNKY